MSGYSIRRGFAMIDVIRLQDFAVKGRFDRDLLMGAPFP
jgi:hypothetical protein